MIYWVNFNYYTESLIKKTNIKSGNSGNLSNNSNHGNNMFKKEISFNNEKDPGNNINLYNDKHDIKKIWLYLKWNLILISYRKGLNSN